MISTPCCRPDPAASKISIGPIRGFEVELKGKADVLLCSNILKYDRVSFCWFYRFNASDCHRLSESLAGSHQLEIDERIRKE
uniref:Uncharacterized protein n=1 Tax=Caenorhabditis japonica TaxID=281687 RepID=A0A8R1IFX3_CAEJA